MMGIIENTDGVTYHGRIGQQELAKHFSRKYCFGHIQVDFLKHFV